MVVVENFYHDTTTHRAYNSDYDTPLQACPLNAAASSRARAASSRCGIGLRFRLSLSLRVIEYFHQARRPPAREIARAQPHGVLATPVVDEIHHVPSVCATLCFDRLRAFLPVGDARCTDPIPSRLRVQPNASRVELACGVVVPSAHDTGGVTEWSSTALARRIRELLCYAPVVSVCERPCTRSEAVPQVPFRLSHVPRNAVVRHQIANPAHHQSRLCIAH